MPHHDSWTQKPEGMYDPSFEHDACGIGFVANIKGVKSHDIVRKGVEVLKRLEHRGAVGSDPDTGDGAGIIMQMPDGFMRSRFSEIGVELPKAGDYASGLVFLPKNSVDACIKVFEETAAAEGCKVIGWRDVPVCEDKIGRISRSTAPAIKQIAIENPGLDSIGFERSLYIIRRVVEKAIVASDIADKDMFYVVSLSSRIMNYKGMLTTAQLEEFFPDLLCEDMESAIGVVHSRYSTNTFPSWPLAQPFRMLCHNGEINTLRGNINRMRSRHSTLVSDIWGDKIEKLLPVIADETGSDSACFDNMLELLVLSGRTLAHSILMMIPEAWGDKYYMGHDRRGFYEFHSMFMEPWDGPAAIAFTDGVQVGGILDRNGLRPARYTVTKDDMIVLASEAGVLDIPASEVVEKGRLQPGKMLLIDTEKQHILFNEEVKADICRQQHYRRWVDANRIEIQGFGGNITAKHDPETLFQRQQAFGYTQEDIEVLMAPMAASGAEPIGSMGNDSPLAVLSDQPQLLFNYFRQIFAQITNPAIDPIREKLVMSLTTFLGREANILTESPQHARLLKLKSPILTDADLERIRSSRMDEFRCVTLDMTFDASLGEAGLEPAMDALCREAEAAINDGVTVIVLSDRNTSETRAPIASLLAVSGVHHYLIDKGIRTRAGLVLESGEPREVNHFALLSSFGVDAVNPYLALETLSKVYSDDLLPGNLTLQDAVENYIKAIGKGMLKILSKMGISTLRSYRGAQVYEALGLSRDFIQKYFTHTVTRIGGIGTGEVAKETLMRHHTAYGEQRGNIPALPTGGVYTYRRNGERHLWSPEAIFFLQRATRTNSREHFDRFSEIIDNQMRKHTTLRSLLDFNYGTLPSIPLEEVEPAENIMTRFVTGAMSFGSLSKEAHEAMAIAMNRIGSRSNSGEGGEDPRRFETLPNGDSACSNTKQVASGRFGVTAEYLANCKEIQIKISQGAKPGEGGHLPGHKVNVAIAKVRHSTPGVSLISPPPHHDIYSIEDLAQLIFDLKNSNPGARISVKLVSVSGVGTIAAGVSKGHADMVLISGGDGGTGASPLSSIKFAGLPWELGLSETHQTLVRNDLRGRIRVQTDGQMRTGRDLAIAALLGAEEYGFGTGALITLGCVMMRKCHSNTCPVGVATQNDELRKRFSGKPEYLINFLRFAAEQMREIMAELGIRTVDEMIGRADLLKVRDGVDHWKAKTVDFSSVLTMPQVDENVAVRKVMEQDHGIDKVLDQKLVADCAPALEKGEKVDLTYDICNVDRTTGTILSYSVAKKYGGAGLPDGTIKLNFNGSAGQSFGAFGARGIDFILNGDSNDYVGKGLSGARIIVRPPEAASYKASENVIIGNVALYGATEGELYISGTAGERFCIRNSGAKTVVEGVGDHACEYMTGGCVAVLGPTGVNFAAGMSGGIAYVYDPHQDFDLRCNLDMVDLDPLTDKDDIAELRGMIEKHLEYTGSEVAKAMLDDWGRTSPLFVKVMPMEYRRALGQMKKVEVDSRKTEAEKVDQA